MRPLFLVFEGIDGAGTTTQWQILCDRFRHSGHDIVATREPGGTPEGERIRDVVLDPALEDLDDIAELLLYGASRRQLVRRVIEPALQAGKPVISDRYALSTVVYQGIARGLGVEACRQVNDLATGGLMPDLVFLLDLDPAEGERRRQERAAVDRLELEGLDFQRRVRQGYLEQAAQDPARVCVLAANGTVEALSDSVYDALVTRFPDAPFRSGPRHDPNSEDD